MEVVEKVVEEVGGDGPMGVVEGRVVPMGADEVATVDEVGLVGGAADKLVGGVPPVEPSQPTTPRRRITSDPIVRLSVPPFPMMCPVLQLGAGGCWAAPELL